MFEYSAVGQKGRFHPTQKPVELYKWILSNYAQHGDKILDTHVGSASSLIACRESGFQYVGFEIDEEYRGEHSTVWLSRDSAKYLAEAENPTDKARANKLDEGFMRMLTDFYEKALINN